VTWCSVVSVTSSNDDREICGAPETEQTEGGGSDVQLGALRAMGASDALQLQHSSRTTSSQKPVLLSRRAVLEQLTQ